MDKRQRGNRRVVNRLHQPFNPDQAQQQVTIAGLFNIAEVKAAGKPLALGLDHQHACL